MTGMIYPRPQRIEEVAATLVIEMPARVSVAGTAWGAGSEALTGLLGRRWQGVAEAAPVTDAPLVIGLLDDPTIVALLDDAGVAVLPEARQAEGYVLHIAADRALVGGADQAGVFYGVQSLLQLATPEGTRLRLPGISVQDWPFKKRRGIHVYMPGREQIPFFKRLLSWLASLKYNTVFLEVSGGMQYERRPEINQAWERFCREADAFPGGSSALYQRSQPFMKDSTHTELGGGSYLLKTEVAELLAYARSLHIEVIPEVQSLSHSYYLCLAYPELAERGDDPYPDTYCPSNPKSYEVLFDVLEEVLEVFEPRVLHIGHDEIYHLGICPRCQGKSGADLLAYEVLRVHQYLAERGIRLGMWGDKLLPLQVRSQGGVEIVVDEPEHGQYTRMPATYQAIDRMPRDILISEWLGNTDARATQFFVDQGFEVVFGNFGENFAAMRFDRWNERSVPDAVVGAEVSTWCDVSEFALGYNGCLFNFLFAAQMMWWRHYRDIDREATSTLVAGLTTAARAELGDLRRSHRDRQEQATPLTLGSGAADTPFDGRVRLDQAAPFQCLEGGRGIRVDAAAPSAEVPVGRTVQRLLLLHACATTRRRRPTWNTVDPYQDTSENLLGSYRVRYTDGETIEAPIFFGSHIANWDVPYGEHIDAIPYWADPVPAGVDLAGRRITLYQYEWENPRSDALVESLLLEHAPGADGTLWLFAAAAV